MLKLRIHPQERYDEVNNRFVYSKTNTILKLEHSLIAVSKWEEKYHKVFLDKSKKTPEEMLYYFQCMVIEPEEVEPEAFETLSREDIQMISDYINDPASATKLNDDERKLMNRGPHKTRDTMTSEMIYYYMSEFKLPIQCEHWRLPRLLTLIELCNMKEWEKDPKNKKKLAHLSGHGMSMAKTYYEINKRRCQELGTTG